MKDEKLISGQERTRISSLIPHPSSLGLNPVHPVYPCSFSGSSSGAALVLVLLFLAILSVLAAEFLYEMRVQSTLLGNQEAKLQARYVAKGGQNAAAALIHHASPESPMFENEQIQLFRYACLTTTLPSLGLTSEQEREQTRESEDMSKMEGCGLWSLSIPYMLGETPIQVDIYDEQSRLNLNALVTVTSGATATETVMTKNSTMYWVVFELFRYEVFKHDLKYSDADLLNMLDALVGYIDCCIVDGSADKDMYQYFEDGDRTIPMKDGPLDTVDEIRYLPGMTDDLFDAVKDFLTVYPMALNHRFDQRINLNAAPVEVIYALIRGTSYQNNEPAVAEDEAMKDAIQTVQEAYTGSATAPGTGLTQTSSGLPRYQRNLPSALQGPATGFYFNQPPPQGQPRCYRIKSAALTNNGFDTTIIKVVKYKDGEFTTVYFKEE